MKIFLFAASRRGHAILKKLIETKAEICGILALVEDPHEEQYHLQVTTIAREHGIPIFYSTDIKPSQYASILKQIKPDIAFAIGWRYIITPEAYQIPEKGTLILHDSLLPKYRGFAPMNWAIINGEKESGVTLFHISEGIDNGPIIDQLSTPIHLHDTAKTVDERIIQLYEDIIVKNLPILQSGEAKGTPQDESLATYSCKRTPDDGEINWQQSAEQIHNLIRACSHPFPGAFTTLKGEKVFIWEAELPKEQMIYVGNIPGRILGKKEGAIEVLTGKGVVRLKRLQFENKEEQNANEIAVSVKDTFGK